MPLRDHFHPPLDQRRRWQAFHSAWATYLAASLNQRLPPRCFAEPTVQFSTVSGVVAIEQGDFGEVPSPTHASWSPPAPVQTVPFVRVADQVEVTIFATEGGPELVGAIELVSWHASA